MQNGKNILAQFLQIAATFLVLGGVMFAGAGRLDWLEGWVFLGIYFLISAAGSAWLLVNDPQLLRERREAITKADVKPWDKAILSVNLILTLALFFLLGWDAGRMQGLQIPPLPRALGGLAVLSSFGITLWASSVNTYLSALVRIQSERGHTAVTGGPYRFVRHPMYAAMCLLYLGLPLLMNAAAAFLAGGLLIAVLLYRTGREDATLQRELPGYAEYAGRVRHRLLPGVW